MLLSVSVGRSSAVLVAGSIIICATPATAGTPYVAIEAGTANFKSNDVDHTIVDFSTAQSPAAPLAPVNGLSGEYDDIFSAKYDRGHEFSIVGGYDFGWVRVDLEASRKKAGVRNLGPDDGSADFLTALNGALNRPTAGGEPAVAIEDFDVGGDVRVSSLMANAMLDVPVTKRLAAFIGYGAGRAWVSGRDDKDSNWGWQRFYGVRYKVGDRIELGLKYRKSTSGVVKLRYDTQSFAGNPRETAIPGPSGSTTTVSQTTATTIQSEIEGEIRPQSIVASLFYNF